LTQLVPALIFHVMQEQGTLGGHFFELTGRTLSNSACSERRQRVPWEIFEQLLQRLLRPIARPPAHAEAFWRGWRLLGVDGTQFNLTNTPQIARQRRKAPSRRGPAAFAKLPVAVLLELGLHNPLAAAVGRFGESEWALAQRLLPGLPAKSLLLADRLYGCAAFLGPALTHAVAVGSHVLVRARAEVRTHVIAALPDGSHLVELPVPTPRGAPPASPLRLREIRARIGRPGHRVVEVRLWTSLLDAPQAPAPDLVALYARRWEHELYFRTLKRVIRKTDVLQSHTVETGAQEVAALVIASAMLAQARVDAGAETTLAPRLSIGNVLRLTTALWITTEAARGVLTDAQLDAIYRKTYKLMQRYLKPPPRPRSTTRGLRQPVSKWPRILTRVVSEGPIDITIA
jgi:hypothetical protein